MRSNTQEWVLIIILSALMTLASLLPMYAFYLHKPAGTVYPLVHNYPPDFYSNLAWMHFGWEGSFAVTSRYTPEQFTPQVASILPFFGMIARVFSLSLPLAYTLARIVFGFGLLVSSFLLAKNLLGSRFGRLVAFGLILFGAPIWTKQAGTFVLAGAYWTGFDPLFRITFLPHHLLSNIFFIAAIILFVRSVDRHSYKLTIIASFCGLVSSWANPASSYTLFVALGIGALINLRQTLRNIGYYLLFFGPLMILSVYMYRLQYSTFPFTTYKDVDRFWFYPIYHGDLLRILGVVSIFAIVGAVLVIRKKSLLWNIVTGWFLAPFIGVEILHLYIPMTNARYFQTVPYIPAALLAAYLLGAIRSKIIIVLLFIIVAINSIPAFAISLKNHSQAGRAKWTLMEYVPETMMDAISWLGTSGKPDEVVLAPFWASTMIPGLTGKRVIVGHQTNVYEPEKKLADFNEFYTYSDPSRALEIIRRNSISYVVAERINTPSAAFISGVGLSPVFENQGVIIYLVQR